MSSDYVDRGLYARRAVLCAGGCGQSTRRRDPVTGTAVCPTCDQRGGGRR